MAAATAQQKQIEQPAQAAVKQTGNEKKEAKKTLSVQLGMVILVVELVLALFVGNMRALQNVSPAAFLKQSEVSSIVEDRTAQAKNVESVVSRASVDSTLIQAVDEALTEFNSAKTAREISRADQKLTTAVSEVTVQAKASLSESDQKNLQKAVDNFTEEGNFLRQQGRAFNEKAEKAVRLYNTLPTRAFLGAPDYYEGL